MKRTVTTILAPERLLCALFFGLFLVGIPFSVSAATLNLSTDKAQLKVGEELGVDVRIDSEGTGINGAQVTLQFPKGILSASSIDKTSSVFNFWLQDPVINNDNGTISFIGGNANGISGKNLEVLHVTFRVVGVGAATLAFTDGAVTASDGNGTNVLTLMNGVTITSAGTAQTTLLTAPVLPPVTLIKRPAVPSGKLPSVPVVTIPLYPHSNRWHNSISPFLVKWQLPDDVTSVSAELNKQPTFDSTKGEGLFDNKTFAALSDGVWYMHVRFKNSIGWGSTTNYQIGIDTVPPLSYSVRFKEGRSTFVMSPTILYQTNDQPSGILLYRIFIDGNEATSTNSTTFTLPSQNPGEHRVLVEAEDFAGNKTLGDAMIFIREHPFLVIGGFSLTQSWFFVLLIGCIALGIIAGWSSYRLWRARVQRKVVIAERDVMNSFAMIGNDIAKLLKNKAAPATPDREATAEFLLKDMQGRVEKAQKYVVENIKEIDE